VGTASSNARSADSDAETTSLARWPLASACAMRRRRETLATGYTRWPDGFRSGNG